MAETRESKKKLPYKDDEAEVEYLYIEPYEGEEEKARQLTIEKSIIKKYRKQLWSRVTKAVRDYELIREGDKVCVCVSGGKDSFLTAKVIQELQKYGPVKFEAIYLCMDPGYCEADRQLIIDNARKMGIPLTMFDSDIYNIVYDVEKSPCYLCARMRRGTLYANAKALGCNKIALGHHYDDVIETILLSMLYGAKIETMMPKLHSQNFEGMELIRPLYLVREEDVKRWASYNELTFIQCACRFEEDVKELKKSSKRAEVKELIAQLREKSPYIEQNIFRSVENVNLRTVIAYHKDGEEHSFLDDYDKYGK
jgi:tRNA 2-thiocytidine biosynthesis protein TtcA